MLWVHPAIQLLGTIFALIALKYGWKRFCASHLGIKCMFPWKDHVQWGQLALLFWFGGLLIGAWAANSKWTASGLTGIHYWAGLVMGALIIFSFVTGTILDKIKKRRKVLPLVHGITGFALIALALLELVTGIRVILRFMLG